jgi:lipopolysaccharide biosynthesis regulator YciM
MAANMAVSELERKPSLQTLEQLLKARGLQANATADNGLIQQTVRYAIGNRTAYCCEQCGFKARNFHWQCPACNAWEALPAEPKETTLQI